MTLSASLWTSAATQHLIRLGVLEVDAERPAATQARIEALALQSRAVHEVAGINLNPASNVMNPRAEALLALGLSTRASLGHPGDKYEMGLEAIEQIEIATGALAAEVFASRHAEFRVGSGALANLYSFMAICEPRDHIIAPPPSIGGHVTHHTAGAAGLYRLRTFAAPIDAQRFTVDVDALRLMAREVHPRLITVGGSLNLFEHPVADIRAVADEVGAKVVFDAAHQCGLIAGKQWRNPLDHGAHVMTMSTYKSLGGPAGGLIVTNEDDLAQKIDGIAYPGLTANFDAGKTAALGVTLADWKAVGRAYAKMMVSTAKALAAEIHAGGVSVFAADRGFTTSHQFAIMAAPFGGGQNAARMMRRSGLLACGIGLPVGHVDGDTAGLRIGTPEIVRMGMTEKDMPELARLIVASLDSSTDHGALAARVAEFRSQFSGVHYTVDNPV